ncbi:hypothetical protein TFLX_02943 [Thermoflexales bacterium]|nr:hypothetical protein TFLX_02943 [Thermoflexales bacterium]
MSEQYPSDLAPPEEDVVQQPVSLSEMAESEQPRNRLGWVAPVWFLFGILVGVIGFAAYNALIVKPAPTSVAALDQDTMRAAARDGTLDAIATLQAGGGPQQPVAQEPQGPQQVASNAFIVRETNRQGSPDAPVTVYEFSDFQ